MTTQDPFTPDRTTSMGLAVLPPLTDAGDITGKGVPSVDSTNAALEMVGARASNAETSAAASATAATAAATDAAAAIASDLGGFVATEAATVGSPTQVALADAAAGITPQAVQAAAGVLNVRTNGATGDGVTNDKPAIQAVIDAVSAAGGGVVVVPPGTYMVTGGLWVRAGVELVLQHGATIKAGSTYSPMIQCEAGVRITGPGTIDGDDESAQAVRVQDVGSVSILGVRITGATQIGVNLSGASDVLIDGCDLDAAGGLASVRISGCTRYAVRGCRIHNWRGRAIYIYNATSDAGGACHIGTIAGCSITDLQAGSADPRHPIQVVGNTAHLHTDLTVRGNIVIGPALSWYDGGTADQISIMWVRGVLVDGNVSRDGGDVGITISTQTYDVRCVGNSATGNDTNGIHTRSSGIVISGNTVKGNGAERNPATGFRGMGRAGIGVRDAADVYIAGNDIADGGAGTQISAFRFNTSALITVGANRIGAHTGDAVFGGIRSLPNVAGEVTGLREEAWRTVTRGADGTRTSTSIIGDGSLTLPLMPDCLYEWEAHLPYSGPGGIQVQPLLPSGASVSWSMSGLDEAGVQRPLVELTGGQAAKAGGAGTVAQVAVIRGTIRTSAGTLPGGASYNPASSADVTDPGGGIVKLGWGQATSSGTASTIKGTALMRVRCIG